MHGSFKIPRKSTLRRFLRLVFVIKRVCQGIGTVLTLYLASLEKVRFRYPLPSDARCSRITLVLLNTFNQTKSGSTSKYLVFKLQ